MRKAPNRTKPSPSQQSPSWSCCTPSHRNSTSRWTTTSLTRQPENTTSAFRSSPLTSHQTTTPNHRPGAISPTDQTLHASKLLLYDISNADLYTWYDITGTPKIMDRNTLQSTSYPFDPQSSTSTPQDKYLVYTIKEISAPEPSVTPAELVQRAVGYDLIDGTKLPSGSFNFIQGTPICIDSYTDLLY